MQPTGPDASAARRATQAVVSPRQASITLSTEVGDTTEDQASAGIATGMLLRQEITHYSFIAGMPHLAGDPQEGPLDLAGRRLALTHPLVIKEEPNEQPLGLPDTATLWIDVEGSP